MQYDVPVIEAFDQAIERAPGIPIAVPFSDCIRCTVEPSIERNLPLSRQPITIWVAVVDSHPKLIEVRYPRRGIPNGRGGK
ncbi:hypothetical protein BRX37_03680 [Sphingomonas sp. S-NIH.Pt3_0716]|nr:hypothetical protein BRX37_03680 [Sphingomonas sp. S-NIH.Pt3_0716]